MCHLILLLPVLALALFWLAPLSIAVPAYAAVLILSGGIYFLAVRAMHRPVQIGVEAILHSRGQVQGREGKLFRVHVGSELWNAESKDTLRPGDRVEVLAIDGLRLRVRRISTSSSLPRLKVQGRNAAHSSRLFPGSGKANVQRGERP